MKGFFVFSSSETILRSDESVDGYQVKMEILFIFSPYKILVDIQVEITSTREIFCCCFAMYVLPLTLSLQAKVIVVMATDTGAWDFYDRNQSRRRSDGRAFAATRHPTVI